MKSNEFEQSNREKQFVVLSVLLASGVLAVTVLQLGAEPEVSSEVLIAGSAIVSLLLAFLYFIVRAELLLLMRNFRIFVPVLWVLVLYTFTNWILQITDLMWRQGRLASQIPSDQFVVLRPVILVSDMIWIFLMGWQTMLVLQIASGRRLDLFEPFTEIRNWFFRALVVLVVGGSFARFLQFYVFTPAESTGLEAILLAIIILIWNVSTFALLIVVIESDRSIGKALIDGIRASLIGFRSWWYLIVSHSLLLGWVVFMPIDLSLRWSTHLPKETQHQLTINAVWVGGYEDSSYWLSSMLNGHAYPLEHTLLLLFALIFIVFATAIKLRIARGLMLSENCQDKR